MHKPQKAITATYSFFWPEYASKDKGVEMTYISNNVFAALQTRITNNFT